LAEDTELKDHVAGTCTFLSMLVSKGLPTLCNFAAGEELLKAITSTPGSKSTPRRPDEGRGGPFGALLALPMDAITGETTPISEAPP